MVCNLGGVFKALRLHQHYLQLGGGVDVYHLVAAIVAPAVLLPVIKIGVLTGPLGGKLLFLLVIIILIIVRVNNLLKFVHQAHVYITSRIYLL